MGVENLFSMLMGSYHRLLFLRYFFGQNLKSHRSFVKLDPDSHLDPDKQKMNSDPHPQPCSLYCICSFLIKIPPPPPILDGTIYGAISVVMTGTGPGIAGEIALESNKGIWLSDQRPTLLSLSFSLSLDIYIYMLAMTTQKKCIKGLSFILSLRKCREIVYYVCAK